MEGAGIGGGCALHGLKRRGRDLLLLLELLLAWRTQRRDTGQLHILLGLLLAWRAEGRQARHLHWLILLLLLLLMGHKLLVEHSGQVHIHLLWWDRRRGGGRRQKGSLRRDSLRHA